MVIEWKHSSHQCLELLEASLTGGERIELRRAVGEDWKLADSYPLVSFEGESLHTKNPEVAKQKALKLMAARLHRQIQNLQAGLNDIECELKFNFQQIPENAEASQAT